MMPTSEEKEQGFKYNDFHNTFVLEVSREEIEEFYVRKESVRDELFAGMRAFPKQS